MPRTRQSGMQPLSHVITPPSGHSRPSLSDGEQAPGSIQDGRNPNQVCSIPTLIVPFWRFTGIRSSSGPYDLRDKQEKRGGTAGNKLPTPSPSSHGAFYPTIDSNYDSRY